LSVSPAVNGPGPIRTRRAEQAKRTKTRILDAASFLFAEKGFAVTTIDAIAVEADVAVETVYSRFGNKATLLREILEVALMGNQPGIDILDLPEIAAIRALTDPHAQLHQLAHLSRSILERSAQGHRILRKAISADPVVAELEEQDEQRRHRVQTAYINMLLANGPLHTGLTSDDAAATYGALANPATYALLTTRRGWTADHYETWLHESLTLLLLDPQPRQRARQRP
jgi:AcrR family transcriptional regulator